MKIRSTRDLPEDEIFIRPGRSDRVGNKLNLMEMSGNNVTWINWIIFYNFNKTDTWTRLRFDKYLRLPLLRTAGTSISPRPRTLNSISWAGMLSKTFVQAWYTFWQNDVQKSLVWKTRPRKNQKNDASYPNFINPFVKTFHGSNRIRPTSNPVVHRSTQSPQNFFRKAFIPFSRKNFYVISIVLFLAYFSWWKNTIFYVFSATRRNQLEILPGSICVRKWSIFVE